MEKIFEKPVFSRPTTMDHISTNHIKNLILDFGGVIYNIDHDRHKQAFRDLGIKNFDKLYSQADQSLLFSQMECGRIGDQDFRNALAKHVPGEISREQLDAAWNAILVGFDQARIALLNALRNRYRLYLLSNTNSIHYRIYTRDFSRQFGYDFDDLFVKTYWSFKVGLRKPDPKIYRFVLHDAGLQADETLFIDDSRQNTISANDAGLPALWLEPGKELSDLFDEKLRLRL